MKLVKIASLVMTVSLAPMFAFAADPAPTIASLNQKRDNVLTQAAPKYKSLDGSAMTSSAPTTTPASNNSFQQFDDKNLAAPLPPPPPPVYHLTVSDTLFAQRLFKGMKLVKDGSITGDDKNANFTGDGQSLKCTSNTVKNGKEITQVSKCDFDVMFDSVGKPRYEGRFAEILFKAISEYSKSAFSDELARITSGYNITTAELTSQGFQQSQVQAQAPNQFITCTKEVTPPPPPPVSKDMASGDSKSDYKSSYYDRSTASTPASPAPAKKDFSLPSGSSYVPGSIAAEAEGKAAAPVVEIPPKYKCNLTSIYANLDKFKSDAIIEKFNKSEVWMNFMTELDKVSSAGDYKLYDTQIYQNLLGATKIVLAYTGVRKPYDDRASDPKMVMDTTIARYAVIYAQPKDRFDINNLVIKNIFVGQ